MGSLLVITGDFNGITHSINGVLLVLITGKRDLTIVILSNDHGFFLQMS